MNFLTRLDYKHGINSFHIFWRLCNPFWFAINAIWTRPIKWSSILITEASINFPVLEPHYRLQFPFCSIFFKQFIDCSLVNTKFLELFEFLCFTFIFMKLIKVSNYDDSKWFFTIAVHDDFFYKISKNRKQKFLRFGP